MALFNPPLYKLGNKKCPNCGQPSRYWDSVRWSNWKRLNWDCPKCQSVLASEKRRLILGILVVNGIELAVYVLIGIWTRPLWVNVLFIIGTLAVAPFAYWWSCSVVVRRPARQASNGTELALAGSSPAAVPSAKAKSAKGFVIASAICAPVALLFWPIIGVAGIVLGYFAFRRNRTAGVICMAVSGVSMVGGYILLFLTDTSS